MKIILDRLDEVEKAAGVLLGGKRVVLDRERVAVAGHSMGSHTASVLMGMTLRDPESGEMVGEDLAESQRIKAGILLAGLGDGGDALSEWAYANLPFHREVSFAEMATPCLVVVGDADESAHLTTRGWKWHADPYYLAPGPKDLLTLFGGDHCFGISGYDAKETVDESMERVAAVQRMTTAYLRGVLCGDGEGWLKATEALGEIGSIGMVESK
jgi:predicted dienelactone hydrolase